MIHRSQLCKNSSLNSSRVTSFNKYEQAWHVITDNYSFKCLKSISRSFTDKEKMQ